MVDHVKLHTYQGTMYIEDFILAIYSNNELSKYKYMPKPH